VVRQQQSESFGQFFVQENFQNVCCSWRAWAKVAISWTISGVREG
jgi:hypothetical protein